MSQPPPAENERYRIGDMVVDRVAGVLHRGGESIELEPRVMEVLDHLIRHPGRPVSKDELLEVVWRGAYVTDHAVWRAISKLRRALGDEPRRPRLLTTRPRRGYVLELPVLPEPGPAFWRPVRPARVRVAAAVLAILLALAYGVTGGGGPGARGPVSPTWAENAALIERLERATARQGGSPTELATLSSAYARQWLRFGTATEDRRWAVASLEAAERAIAEAPRSPSGHIALGIALRAVGRLGEAEAAYRRALALDPDSLDAANDLGHLLRDRGDLSAALRLHEKVLAVQPDHPASRIGRARVLMLLRDLDRAETDAWRVLELAPSVGGAAVLLVRAAILRGNLEEAQRRVAELAEAWDEDPLFLEAAAAAAHRAGDRDRAIDLLHRATADHRKGGMGPAYLRLAAIARQSDPKLYSEIRAGYRAWIRAEEEAGSEHWRAAYWRAAFAAIEGRGAEATEHLREAARRGFRDAAWVAVDPIFDAVRRNPGAAASSRPQSRPSRALETAS